MSIVSSLISSSSGDSAQVALNQSGVNDLYYKTGVNSIRLAILETATVYSNGKTLEDVFADESGIDTGTSTANYDSANDKYGEAADVGYSLLIHSNTTDGSTTFTDSSSNGFTITANGDVQHDTAQFKIGASSILFDGTGDYLSIADNAAFAFGTGDFTLSAWIRPTDTSAGDRTIMGQWNAGWPAQRSWWLQQNGTSVKFDVSTSGSGSTRLLTATSALSAETWAHVEVVKSGTDLYLFVDGVVADSDSSVSDNLLDSTNIIGIGAYTGGGGLFVGHMDEIRVIKGAGEHTTTFTPPTTEYVIQADNFVLQAENYVTTTAPINSRFMFLHEHASAITLNTDIVAECSRDDGTTWTAYTLSVYSSFKGSSTVDIVVSDYIDLTSQPSDTDILWRITTANNKSQYIQGAYLMWEEA